MHNWKKTLTDNLVRQSECVITQNSFSFHLKHSFQIRGANIDPKMGSLEAVYLDYLRYVDGIFDIAPDTPNELQLFGYSL